MRTIKGRILASIVCLVFAALAVVGITASCLTYQSTKNTLQKTMNELAVIAAGNVANSLDGYRNLTAEIATNEKLVNSIVLPGPKQSEMDRVATRSEFTEVTYLNVEGKTRNREDFSQTEGFVYAKANLVPYISDPYIDTNGKIVLDIVAPILVNGNFMGAIVCVRPTDFLSDIVGQIEVGEGGTAMILKSDGTVIADTDVTKAETRQNYITRAKEDKSTRALGEISKKMITGEVGFETYTENGVKRLMAYAPIENTNGWSIGVSAPQNDFMTYTVFAILVTVAIAVLAILVAYVVAKKLAHNISEPIKLCADNMDQLAKGNFSMDELAIEREDETAILINAFNITVANLRKVVSDVSENLGQLANGNMDIEITEDYDGDFKPIKASLEKIIYSLNQTLSKIQISSEQVSGGAGQVSNGAQALSQGATKQASAIEELSATIADISQKVNQTAESATSVNESVKSANDEVVRSNKMMREMLHAMTEISSKSSEIGKIIKAIDDIAFQTNILALNAAVEAARAGQAGKGFAVVANEVRNLASKSAEAASSSTKLIEDTLLAVKNGTRIANDTAESLNEVVTSTEEVAEVIHDIAGAATEQSVAISQITFGVDQISAVIQTNSATAEQSAAASEELSGQAQMLKDLTGTFRLKNLDDLEPMYFDDLEIPAEDIELPQEEISLHEITDIDLGEEPQEIQSAIIPDEEDFTDDVDDKYAADDFEVEIPEFIPEDTAEKVEELYDLSSIQTDDEETSN